MSAARLLDAADPIAAAQEMRRYDLTHALAALSNGMAQELLARFPKED